MTEVQFGSDYWYEVVASSPPGDQHPTQPMILIRDPEDGEEWWAYAEHVTERR